MTRDLVHLGHKTGPATSRWLLNVYDVIKLAVLHDLCVRASFPAQNLGDGRRLSDSERGDAGPRRALPAGCALGGSMLRRRVALRRGRDRPLIRGSWSERHDRSDMLPTGDLADGMDAAFGWDGD
jgi:hypothetical protein